MIYSNIGAIHLTAAILALVTGTVVFVDAKGHVLHRALGTAYVAAMVLTNASAFGLFRLTGSIALFHVLAAISLLTLAIAMARLFSRRPDRVAQHGLWMLRSYLGLLAAAVIESMVRIPAIRAQLDTPADVMWLGGAVAAAFVPIGRLVAGRLALRPAALEANQGAVSRRPI
jgi:uncharacterized membrane protein